MRMDPRLDECLDLPSALIIAGVGTVIAPMWPIEEGFAALWTDLFYERLTAGAGVADLAALVREVNHTVRAMSRDSAAERLSALASGAQDSAAYIRLLAYGQHLERGTEPVFAHPWWWAAFLVYGRGRVLIEEGRSDGKHPRAHP